MTTTIAVSISFLLWDLILIFLALLFHIVGQNNEIFSISNISPLFIGAGVLVALITLLLNIEKSRSENYLKGALDLLEKSYIKLAKLDENGRPLNDRMIWLSSARLLLASEKIANLISEKSHKYIYEENREYWRSQFHDLLRPNDESAFPSDYYAEKPEHLWGYRPGGDRPPLAESSLVVLYRFIEWPKGYEDRIGPEHRFTEEEINAMIIRGPRGLGNLFYSYRQWRANKGLTIS